MATAAPAGCPVDESFDPLSPESRRPLRGPGQTAQDRCARLLRPLDRLLRHHPLRGVEEVFMDPASSRPPWPRRHWPRYAPRPSRSCSRAATSPGQHGQPGRARTRPAPQAAARAFSMKRVTAMIPAIEATTARLLDAVATETEFNLVAALAFPLPANIVFSLMGVPEQDFALLKDWCGYRAALSWGRRGTPTRWRSPPPWLPTAGTSQPGRGQGRSPRRRPDQRPDRHPPRGPGSARPGRDLLDPVLAVVRRPRPPPA